MNGFKKQPKTKLVKAQGVVSILDFLGFSLLCLIFKKWGEGSRQLHSSGGTSLVQREDLPMLERNG